MVPLVQVLCPEFQFHTGCNEPLAPCDLVMVGSNRGPVYEIVHISGALAWLRPLANGEEGLSPVDNLRLVPSASS